MSKLCIETKNYDGLLTIFTEKQREEKSKKHPELRQKLFIEKVKEVIEDPDFVYKDLDIEKDNRFVYYLREFKLNEQIFL